MSTSLPLDPTITFQAFRASMPDRYLNAFDRAATTEHAAIVARRAGAAAHIEIWRQLPQGVVVLCIVADDRPGLLSFISAALVIHRMDVLSAQAYTRRVSKKPGSGGTEAVDFLWLRRESGADSIGPIREVDIEQIGSVLDQLIRGDLSIESAVERASSSRTVPRGASTRVTFGENEEEGLAVLTVETFDRPGLLLVITLALFRAGVQIIASDAVTRAGAVVDRFSIVERDGTPIRQNRRGLVQIEVLGAIEALSRARLGA